MNLKQLQKKFIKQAPENSKAAYEEEILEEQISMISDFEGVNWHGSIDVYERTALVRSTKEMNFLSRCSKCSCCEFSNRRAKWCDNSKSGTWHIPLILCSDYDPFAPTLCVELFNQPVTILLNSRAACSVIDSAVVANDASLYVRLNASNGTLMVFKGKTTLGRILDQSTFIHNFFVVQNIPWDVILGTCLLTKYGGRLNFMRMVFTTRNSV